MKKYIREQKAITLIALIITVILLLVLTIVSIRLVMNGGIIEKTLKGVQKFSDAELEEQIKLAFLEWEMISLSNNSEDMVSFMQRSLREKLNDNNLIVEESSGVIKVTMSDGREYRFVISTGKSEKMKPISEYPEIAADTSATENSKYVSNGKTAIIPKGYKVSNVASEQNIDTGLVIKDNSGNEWVWIPVSTSDFSVMFGTASDDGWTMSGTTVKTKYESNGGIISNIHRGNSGDISSFREPDVLNNDNYDKNATNLSAAGLGSNITEMATNLRNDYKNMVDSVRKNGGFYVGRYELSNAGTQKNQTSLTTSNWYNLYAKCKTLGNDYAETRMIWGCQWDQVCKFISTSGDQVSLADSTSYGNYNDSVAPANTGNYSKNSRKNTGSNDAWKANNIYDMAGNCWEWTQEAGRVSDRDVRACRGGVCTGSGSSLPVSMGGDGSGPTSGYQVSSRPTLYVD